MLHLKILPDESPQPYADAIARLASVRQALRLVGPFGSGPAPDDEGEDNVVAAAWDGGGEARQGLFERRSERMVCAASAGVEALLTEHDQGREPHWAASDAMIEEIRRELREV